jgi:uncharacterized CHY-type Zn-finger protein
MSNDHKSVPVSIHGVDVYGVDTDHQTRCMHYHSDVDIIALRFPCCNRYYPCFTCHQETADHPSARWDKMRFGEKAVLCGACGQQLTVHEYMACGFVCPACQSSFNTGCKSHYHLYFEVEGG